MRDRGEAPDWDAIVRTPAWDVVHAYDTSLAGWTVLVLRRHAGAVAELTDDEAASLGPLIRDVSRGLASATRCAKTYVVQFAEHPQHPHVHVHVIPRPADLPESAIGPRVFSLLGVPVEQRVPEARMNEIALCLRDALS